MKKLLVLIIFTALLFAEAIDRTGPYLSLGGGYAGLDDDKRMQGDVESSYNVNLIGGAFINKYFSVELAVDYYDKFTTADNTNSTTVYFIDAAAKVHYPFWRNRIDIYASFGAGAVLWKEHYNGGDENDRSSALRGDVGIGYRLLDDLTLNLGYRRYFFILDDDTGGLLENGDPEIIRYNMQIGSAYANIEVQF